MGARIGVDADSGPVQAATTTAANEADMEQVADLLHGQEEQVWGDPGHRGAQSRLERQVKWHIAARPGDIAKLPDGQKKERLQHQERAKTSIRARFEHPCRGIKRQFGRMQVRPGSTSLHYINAQQHCVVRSRLAAGDIPDVQCSGHFEGH